MLFINRNAEGSSTTLHIKDLASKFGTCINGDRIPAQELCPIAGPESSVMLGESTNNGITIRFTYRNYKFCASKLDKGEKDILKVRQHQ